MASGKIQSVDTEKLKEEILKKTPEKEYSSSRFSKIESQVIEGLAKQDTQQVLKDITLGALVLGSSDIHYECFIKYVLVRFRIDGVLVDIFKLTHIQYKKIVERLKYSSNLKLNITNIPQDGKYSFELEGEKKIDVRVSTLPIAYGENIVCRILDSQKAIIDFEDLGFFWTSKRMLEKAISKKSGMILVTGPTGSGKTTTLYTILNHLNTREKKIITLEDPIEYQLEGIVQSEIDDKNGVTFASGLKACLRQDPDIIMVGEIRDFETLQTATSASLTGHLVLSTLHTKSAADTLDRIINMGLKPYILASALDTIIAQRLVRKICPHCKVQREKSNQETALIEAMMKETGMNIVSSVSMKLYEGTGCEKCNHSGYKGRIGVYEIITLNEKIKEIIRSGGSVEQVIHEARNGDLITMKEDGILKALKGFTTIEEIIRVI
ncbi:type II/IV secretion system protein [Candidatus Gracilibacteria bacterium]|nr:type II/IV secretion system protein [Candidatus Gracilibacteria bacterium]